MSQRVLVCGGRKFNERNLLFTILDDYHSGKHGECGQFGPFSVVIHGAQRGADTLAGEWARERGIPELPFPADWTGLGKKAGPIRNAQMLKDGKPDVVIAFPGHTGTQDMTNKAFAADIPIITVQLSGRGRRYDRWECFVVVGISGES